MSVVPAAPFLVDFASTDLASEVAEEIPQQASAAGGEADWAERVEEAYARGIEEGKRSAEAETVALLEEQKAARACVGESPSWLRHRILIPTFEGSNPSSPAKPFRNLWVVIPASDDPEVP